MAEWLGVQAFTALAPRSIPGWSWGLRCCKPQGAARKPGKNYAHEAVFSERSPHGPVISELTRKPTNQYRPHTQDTVMVQGRVTANRNSLLGKKFPQSCLTFSDPMDCSLCLWNSPGKHARVHRHSLLRGVFPTQESNPGLLHCRWRLYHLSHEGNPGQERVKIQTHSNRGPWQF